MTNGSSLLSEITKKYKNNKIKQNKSKENVWRVIPLKINDGPTNMAIDEAILIARSQNLVPNTIRFYRWNPSTASIGKNQSVSREIDLEAAKKYNVDVVRRISGGGAVYHDRENEITYMVVVNEDDLRNIFYKIADKMYKGNDPIDKNPMAIESFSPSYDKEVYENGHKIESIKGNIKENENINKNKEKYFFSIESSYHVITMGLVKGLELIGVKVDQGVIHCPALFINKRKISGNAQARRYNTILQHGTILLKVDPEFMYTILKAPEGVPKKKMVASVRAKVSGIFNNIKPMEDDEIVRRFVQGFEEGLGIKCRYGRLTEYEMNLVEEIKQKRYSNNEWLYKIP
ncbi:MAG: lipoate--protein ligase family protein [Promethearchaeota archaeon]